MFDQLTIFTPQGQVLFKYNCQGKKFAELQINTFISKIITSPVTQRGSKFNILNITNDSLSKSNVRPFCSMFHVTKQPELYFVITYAEQTIDLDKEAEKTLDLALKLWDSLDLNEEIQSNLKNKQHVDILYGMNEDLSKFDKYLRAKYEESIKFDVVNATNDNVSREASPRVDSLKKNSLHAKNKGNNGGGRKWGRNGMMEETTSSEDVSQLDFSRSSKNKSGIASPESNFDMEFDKNAFGERTDKGEFLIKEIDDLLTSTATANENESQTSSTSQGFVNSTMGFIQRNLIGNKTITESDLRSVLDKLKKKLITKNVAPEAADFLTEQVSNDLLGSKTANWTSVEVTARASLTKALTQILTPGVSVDLLHEIQKKTGKKDNEGKAQPYVFSIVGVNGVGKSTNLSKLAFWLLQNNFKVLIVACDTFRSGAVEQLRVHVENLAQLMDESHIRGSKNKRGKTGNDFVELFESGYGGSDLVTKIAKQAIKYAHDQEFDIVLMDTAGRRHNDPTLMSPLKSFAEQAQPDKIIMVGEASFSWY